MNNTINHILVPVDGSDYATRALEVATELAKRMDSRITLIYVMADTVNARIPAELKRYAEVEHVDIRGYDLLEGVAKKILHSAEQKAQDLGIKPVAITLQQGNPAAEIVDYAKHHDIDLIVMGSRGLGDLGGLLLGSISHKVAHLAPCSCLLAK